MSNTSMTDRTPSGPMGQAPMVRLKDVHLTLTAGGGPVKILRGVDLNLGKGETLSVVGPSGSGKTTMLMIISGLERPSRGRVEVAGQDLLAMNEDGLARFRSRHIGVVFQAFHLAPSLTALENAALPLEFSGSRNAMELAAQGLAAVGLKKRMNHYPSQLSGGEQQRVAIARAFVTKPSLILADEPTGNLDEKTGRLVAELLFSLQQKHGTSMILITHDRALAGLSSRQARMIGGVLDGAGLKEA